jgi:hypothetical protein
MCAGVIHVIGRSCVCSSSRWLYDPPMRILALALGISLTACTTETSPTVDGRVTLPPNITLQDSSFLVITMWSIQTPGLELAKKQGLAKAGLDFHFDLAEASAFVDAYLDLTGDGGSGDDLRSDDIEVAQGAVDVEIALVSVSATRP